MVDVWLDAVTPKDSLLIYSLLPSLREKGYRTLVTAKKQTQTTDILELLNVNYTHVGEYGENLKEKLIVEQKRTLQFLDVFDKVGMPKVLWTHGDVSATRTAFGLQIPIVYSNDTPHAVHVAKLICPLVNWLVAPVAFGKSWSKFGISKSKIASYNGVEETAWLFEPVFERPKFLEELTEKERIVLFRNAEYKASYCKDVKVDTWQLLKELSEIATVIYMPRYAGEEEKLKDIDRIWIPPKLVLTAQLIPYVDLMVGSGGTVCRETALMGIPTINFHFWDAIARYLYKRNFPIQCLRSKQKIIKIAKEILKKPETGKMNTKETRSKMESPVSITLQYIETCLKPEA
jgi:predicted glycosyltransferase